MSRKAEVSIVVLAKNKAKQVLTGLRGNLTKVKNAVFSLHGAMMALGSAAIVRIGSSLIKAFGVQESAVIKLNAALRATGRYTEEASRQIQQQAAELQKLTIHGDEATIAATASMLMLADKIPVSQLEDAQKAIIGIADTFMGGDLNNAALIIGKTLSSTTNALTRYGIEVDTSASQQEKLAQITEQSIGFFEVSEESTSALTHQMEQLGNALGDSKELFGEALGKSLGFTEGIEGATEKVQRFNEQMQQAMETIVKWGRFVVSIIKAVVKTLIAPFRLALEAGLYIGDALTVVVTKLSEGILWLVNKAIDALNWLIRAANKIPGVDIGEIGNIEALQKAFESESRAAANRLYDRGINMIRTLQNVGDAWIEMGEKALIAVDLMEEATGGLEPPPDAGAGTGAGEVDEGRIPLPPVPERPQLPGPEFITEDWIPDEVEILSFWQKLGEELQAITSDGRTFAEVIADDMVGAIQGFGAAATDAFQLMFEGSNMAAKAFAQGMLAALATVAKNKGDFFLAEALASYGAALMGHPTAAAAGTQFTLAATAMYALAGGAAAAAGGGGGGGGSGGGSPGFGGSMAESSALEGRGRGQATLIIEGGLLDMGDPRQQDSLARALSTLSGLDVTVRGR